jgi:hypothetical protein
MGLRPQLGALAWAVVNRKFTGDVTFSFGGKMSLCMTQLLKANGLSVVALENQVYVKQHVFNRA